MYVHGYPHAKFCPLCWQEQKLILLPWSLRHVTTCARHQVLLVDHCSHCGTRLQADWAKGSCRACQGNLADLPALSTAGHGPSLAISALIWSALGCNDESFPPQSLGLRADHLV